MCFEFAGERCTAIGARVGQTRSVLSVLALFERELAIESGGSAVSPDSVGDRA